MSIRVSTHLMNMQAIYNLVLWDELPLEHVLKYRGLWYVEVSKGTRTIRKACCGIPNKRDIRKAVKVAKKYLCE